MNTKRIDFIKRIATAVFLCIYLASFLILVVYTIEDILYYDTCWTSFPPFSSCVLLSLYCFPFLLAAFLFYSAAGKTQRRHRERSGMQIVPCRRLLRVKKASAAALIVLTAVILTGTFVTIPMKTGTLSVLFDSQKLIYLCLSYSPLLLIAAIELIISCRQLKKDSVLPRP